MELCPIIQPKSLRPDAATYSRRITNNTFYRPAKIVLCIWWVGNGIAIFNKTPPVAASNCLRESFPEYPHGIIFRPVLVSFSNCAEMSGFSFFYLTADVWLNPTKSSLHNIRNFNNSLFSSTALSTV